MGTAPASVTNQTGLYEKLVNWVADAVYDIESKYGNWDFLWDDTWTENVTQGTPEYSPPTDLGHWDRETFYLNYSAATYKKLKEMGYRNWKNNYGRGTQTQNEPSYFIVQPDKTIRLWPVPDAAYTLSADYWRKPIQLTANSDTSQIPEEHERVIKELAKIKFATDQGAGILLQSAMTMYQEWFMELEARELPGQEHRRTANTEPLVVVPE